MSLEQPCISTVYGFCYSYPLLTEAIVQVHNEIFLFFGVILKIEDQASVILGSPDVCLYEGHCR